MGSNEDLSLVEFCFNRNRYHDSFVIHGDGSF